jgi:hypothetical protein
LGGKRTICQGDRQLLPKAAIHEAKIDEIDRQLTADSVEKLDFASGIRIREVFFLILRAFDNAD